MSDSTVSIILPISAKNGAHHMFSLPVLDVQPVSVHSVNAARITILQAGAVLP